MRVFKYDLEGLGFGLGMKTYFQFNMSKVMSKHSKYNEKSNEEKEENDEQEEETYHK